MIGCALPRTQASKVKRRVNQRGSWEECTHYNPIAPCALPYLALPRPYAPGYKAGVCYPHTLRHTPISQNIVDCLDSQISSPLRLCASSPPPFVGTTSTKPCKGWRNHFRWILLFQSFDIKVTPDVRHFHNVVWARFELISICEIDVTRCIIMY